MTHSAAAECNCGYKGRGRSVSTVLKTNMSTFKDLGISSSQSTVTVKAMDVGASSTCLPAEAFIDPVLPGYETFSVPIYAFLIEHEPTGKRLMFDLGMRTDQEGFSPAIQQMLKLWKSQGFEISADKSVSEKLQEGGVDSETINAVIWSHSHLDHCGILLGSIIWSLFGDMSKFPSSTELVIGPGMDTRTFPSTLDSSLLESDFAGRKVTELNLTDFEVTIGDYEAFDYFSDGSFYILNSPGHQPGHITALARVTPTSFVLLGGDSCHHPGELRPTADHHKYFPCPGRILESLGDISISSRTTPLLSVPSGSPVYADRETSLATISKLSRFDANPDVLVLIAHDSTAPGVIDEFPTSMNDWKAKGWKDKLMWAFLEKDSPAFRFG
ncbi:beta-lactamase-like protein [Desarmillaria tabescens]|uniref:Beta-lactamase-like protein n=1 Tax=Armillaria tabescens TaxID=1929756 RepID=A0AA39K1D5_ARMTA|nr:beta-lactamase-like protein [Desarmillaria tabescens]KAK0452796.1 beta-lactamase-like protein [Desarmillaria tabescens]